MGITEPQIAPLWKSKAQSSVFRWAHKRATQRTPFCSLLIHYTMTTLPTPDGLARLDLVLRPTIWYDDIISDPEVIESMGAHLRIDTPCPVWGVGSASSPHSCSWHLGYSWQ